MPVDEICAVPKHEPLGSVSVALKDPLQNGDETLPTSGSASTFFNIAWREAWWAAMVPVVLSKTIWSTSPDCWGKPFSRSDSA